MYECQACSSGSHSIQRSNTCLQPATLPNISSMYVYLYLFNKRDLLKKKKKKPASTSEENKNPTKTGWLEGGWWWLCPRCSERDSPAGFSSPSRHTLATEWCCGDRHPELVRIWSGPWQQVKKAAVRESGRQRHARLLKSKKLKPKNYNNPSIWHFCWANGGLDCDKNKPNTFGPRSGFLPIVRT